MKFDICILANETPSDHEPWVVAIKKSGLIRSFDIVNLVSENWFSEIRGKTYDLFILRPPGKTELFKRLYDERVLLINQYLSVPIYPSLYEVLIYENKRYLRDWLMVNHLPHPETFVFFDEKEAKEFLKKRQKYPIVGKTNIGASGNGVIILNDNTQLQDYIEEAFHKGIKAKSGPKLSKGSLFKKAQKLLKIKGFLKQRIKDYLPSGLNIQYHYVILQEYISHEFEWRCVRIGDSFFAHKKIAKKGKASGHLLKRYDTVPVALLDFIRDVTNKTGLRSVSIDVFERNNTYLINEIQCFFGQSDPYQMLVNNVPGRYVYINESWTFEEGMFNTNLSYDLRLKDAISLIKKR